MKDTLEELLASDEEVVDAPITFWFTKGTKLKYAMIADHPKKRKLIARIKKAAAAEIDLLFEKLSDVG